MGIGHWALGIGHWALGIPHFFEKGYNCNRLEVISKVCLNFREF